MDSIDQSLVPHVSIVIPTFNRRVQLHRTLEAIASQITETVDGHRFTYEVIVVSDGSTDGTVEAVRSLDVPFRLSVLDQINQGPAAARNAGIGASRGELVVFIDDDVIPEPACVAAHVALHDAVDDLVVIGPMLTPSSGLSPWVGWEQHQLEKQYERFVDDPTASHRQFYTGNASVARDALVAVGGFDVALRRAEDIELAHRLHGAGLSFRFESAARAFHHAERSFESWKRVGYDYGVNDVAFGRSAQPDNLRLIGLFFRERRPSQRWFIHCFVPYRRLAGLVERLLSGSVRLTDRSGREHLTQPLLSLIYSLNYYHGVLDGVGSTKSFRRLLRGGGVAPVEGAAGSLSTWFVLEQTLGHVTHGANLTHLVPQVDRVIPMFIPVDASLRGAAARVPGWGNWTVRAGIRARFGLRRARRVTGRLADVMFVHSQVPAVLLGRWMRRVPTVVSLDATPLQYDELGDFYAHETGSRWIESIKRRANRRCFDRARHLVTWSDWAKQGLVDGYGVSAEKITVIAPGVNVERWTPPAGSSGSEGPLRILFVGSDLDRKGGTLLLAAAARLREKEDVPEFEVTFVTTSDVDATDGVVVKRGLTPNSAELIEQYHRADIFCLPTLGDCLPMVLAEAGAAGLPLVSTDVGAISEVVRSRETGMLIEPGDVDALEEALRLLLTDDELRVACGRRAASLIGRSHNARTNVDRLVAVLDEAAQ